MTLSIYDYAALTDEECDALIEKAKVAFNSGHIYGPLGKDYVRLNFATSPAIITEAIERIARVL